MTATHGNASLEETLREYLRLRRKHSPSSPQGESYRAAIREQIRMLRAFRLARHANRDLVLPPMKKPSKARLRPTETGSPN